MQSDPLDLSQALTKYYQMGAIAESTVRILGRFIADWNTDSALSATGLPSGMPLRSSSPDLAASQVERVLGLTLEHLASVREGFQLQLRAEWISLPELQFLVERALVNWNWFERLGWELTSPEQVEIPDDQLMAFAHAYVALAMLPRLPNDKITFPSVRNTYADIPVPSSGAELLSRLEELDAVIYRILGQARARVESEPLRRTYGFFETSAWLVSEHQHRFKKPFHKHRRD